MRNSTLTSLALVVLGFTANAQKFAIRPYVGLESPRTNLSYNNLSVFKPLQSQISPALGVRVDYKLKKGHGPFVGFSTSRSSVAYSFANPETGMNAFTASAGNMQFQLQGGWQASSKPFYFKKSASTKTATKSATNQNRQSTYKSCGGYRSMSHCGGNNRSQAYKAPKNKSWFVRIIPSAGLAFNPFTPANVTSKIQNGQGNITYNAGNFKTAFISGAGFEFGRGTKQRFIVTINYFKGLGDNAEKITTEGVKTITTNLSSKVSGWTASLGIPLALTKKSAARQVEKKKCEFKQYKSSCRRVI